MNTPTPGTWIAKDGQIYTEETGKTLAVIPHFDNEPEQIANQKLMAAAPAMLEELKHIIERLEKIIISNPKRKEEDPFIVGFAEALRNRAERAINEINN